jgi:ubiquitin C-terminal hydrolase
MSHSDNSWVIVPRSINVIPHRDTVVKVVVNQLMRKGEHKEEEEDKKTPKNKAQWPVNQNSSCYIDSVLVCLLHSPSTVLCKLFTETSSFYDGDKTLIRLLQKLCKRMSRQPERAVSNDATSIVNSIREHLTIFTNNTCWLRGQQDASELMSTLIDMCKLDNSNRRQVRIQGANDLISTIPDELITTSNRLESASIIHHVVDWVDGVTSSTTCLKNTSDSGVLDRPYVDTVTQIPYLRLMTSTSYQPESGCFVIHIDRSLSADGTVDTRRFIIDSVVNGKYKLTGIVYHSGQLGHGHYTALLMHEGGTCVSYYDDARHPTIQTIPLEAVVKVNMKLERQCVLLFYSN